MKKRDASNQSDEKTTDLSPSKKIHPMPVAAPETDPASGGWSAPVYTRSREGRIKKNKAVENRIVGFCPEAPENEYYKILRTQIQQRADARGWNTIMITSALPEEGKTVTAINLAMAFARVMERTALLVDCDLRHPSVHKYLGFRNEAGLVDYLLGERLLEEIIVWPGVEKLSLISGGRKYREGAELLGSGRMGDLMAEMKHRYPDRYILFDTPALLDGAEALSLMPWVDGVLMVVAEGRTGMEAVKEALERIPEGKFLGFAMNRQRRVRMTNRRR